MAEIEQQNARPWWVRAVVPVGAKRQTIQLSIVLRAMLASVSLGLAGIESNQTSKLSQVALPLGLVAAVLLATSVVWSVLAARWVSHHSTWA